MGADRLRKAAQTLIKTISQDISKGGYPSMSNLKVQSEIVKVIQNFEQLQIIMNESMQKCSCNEELVREPQNGISTESELDFAITVFCHNFNVGFWSLRLSTVIQGWSM